jgi:hypothetical protein
MQSADYGRGHRIRPVVFLYEEQTKIDDVLGMAIDKLKRKSVIDLRRKLR